MRFKMHDATANTSQPSLCRSCRNAHRVRMRDRNVEEVRCSSISDRVIPGPVAECSGYDNKAHPTLHMMKQIAWHVSSDKGRVIGFLSPREYREKRGDHEDGPLMAPDGTVYY